MMTLALFIASATLDVVFLPDAAEQPAVVVVVEQDGAKRSISWAVLTTPSISGALEDNKGAARSLLPLPQAPSGASLVENGGALVITVDDAGAWQDKFVAASTKGRGLPVAGATSMRLVISGAAEGATDAEIVGARLRAPGKAFVTSKKPSASAVVRAGKDVIAGSGAAIDSIEACGKVVPTAISIPSSSLKLVSAEPPACAGKLAVVRVTGVRVEAKRDTPVAGVVLTR
jgi:hypothetical protein